jgi:hypothetical protein
LNKAGDVGLRTGPPHRAAFYFNLSHLEVLFLTYDRHCATLAGQIPAKPCSAEIARFPVRISGKNATETPVEPCTQYSTPLCRSRLYCGKLDFWLLHGFTEAAENGICRSVTVFAKDVTTHGAMRDSRGAGLVPGSGKEFEE